MNRTSIRLCTLPDPDDPFQQIERRRTLGTYLETMLRPLETTIASGCELERAASAIGAFDLGGHPPPAGGIEVPLATPEPGFDLSIGFSSGFGNKEAASEFNWAAKVEGAWTAASDAPLFASDRPSARALWRRLDRFWFEFDLIAPQDRGPSFYFSTSAVPNKSVDHALTAQQVDDLVAGLECLAPELTVAQGELIKDLLTRYRARAPYVLCGLMLGRVPAAVRLVFRFATVLEAAAYLAAAGLADDKAVFADVDEGFSDLINDVLVGFEPFAAPCERLGVELYTTDRTLREGGADRQLIARLTEMQLCDPSKADALVAYPGDEILQTGLERWPVQLDRDGFAAPALAIPICARRYHHVKLTVSRRRIVDAKAYLDARFQWRRL